jgi:hypothetical protein
MTWLPMVRQDFVKPWREVKYSGGSVKPAARVSTST